MGYAQRPQLYGEGARDYLCTQLFRRVHSGHRAHRRGLLQLCPLVGHLDRREFFGGGSTVGAWVGSGEHVRARSQEIRGHRAQPSLGVGRCIAVQGEAASKQPVGLGDERRWVRLIARGEAQLVGAGRLVGEAG